MKIEPGIRAIVFDLDGTLLKTYLDYDALRMSIPNTVKRLGAPPEKFSSKGIQYVMEVSEYLASIGKPMSPKEILKNIAEDMCDVEMKSADKSEYIPGTKELIAELKKRGYKVAILTNGFRRYVKYNLEKHGMYGDFDFIQTYDDLEYGQQKPSPDAMKILAEKIGVKCDEILYVGDGKVDYISSSGAGAHFVGVTTGSMNEEKWKELSPDIKFMKTITNLLD